MNEQPTADTKANEVFLNTLRHNARAIQPHPDFVAAFEQQMTQVRPARPRHISSLLRTLSIVATVLILVSAAFVTVPPLRAIAQEVINLLIRAESDRQRRDITGLTAARESFASVDALETQLELDVAVPVNLPTGHRFDGNTITPVLEDAVYDPDSGAVILSYVSALQQPNAPGHPYRGWWLWINQIPGDVYHADNESDAAQGQGNVGASAQIETLTLTFRGAPVTAQFVRGGWDIQGGLGDSKIIDEGGSVNRAVQWVDDGRMRLIWEADGIVYVMHSIEDTVFNVTRDDLVRIAESME